MKKAQSKPKGNVSTHRTIEQQMGIWSPERVKQFNEYKPAKNPVGKIEWSMKTVDEEVVKVLRQLKSQMGRAVKAEYGMNTSHTEGIKRCMVMVDNKITKLNKTTRK